MTNEAIRAALESVAEPDYCAFSRRLLPGTDDLLGVRLPALRKLARRLAKTDVTEYLSRAADNSFEERLLQGLTLAYAPLDVGTRRQALLRFLPKIDNWSICDSTCITCRFMREDPGYWWDFLLPLTRSEEEYHVRFALVCILDHFITGPSEAGRVLNVCAEVEHPAYYVKMARAWAIAECATAAPEAALALIAGGRLDDFTRNAAIRKICESLRLSPRNQICRPRTQHPKEARFMKTLLHICCAPCSIACIRQLREEGIEPTGFWYNPNIHPMLEYKTRKNTLVEYAKTIDLDLIIKNEYGLRAFIQAIYPDFNHRCDYCYRVRLEETARTAAENGFTHFTTTLLISPYQNHELICKTAEEAAAKYGVQFLYRDFRPRFREGQDAAREAGMYMQKYCGCVFSEEDRYTKRKKPKNPQPTAEKQ